MYYLRDHYSSLPSKPGVYAFLNKENKIIYVGKAINLKARVSSYFTDSNLGEKTRLLVSNIYKIRITLVESEIEALLLEAYLIKKNRPYYNIRLTDGKAYLLVRITLKDPYPKVLLARREENSQDIYFGPFPNSTFVKLVLKTLRKAFPYQSVFNHPKRICLYNHLGLCPCPPVNDSANLKIAYRKNIKSIIRIFEGDTRKIIKETEKKRDILSKEERFEEAYILQKRLDALNYITQPFRNPSEYLLNPNLRNDLRQAELDNLKSVLVSQGMNIPALNKIECFDISNIQGTSSTGSMVVFVAGEKEGSLYRKFKIKRIGKPDDFASMTEVIKRRLKHAEWPMPDLIIVDGGKGQVSCALAVLQENNCSIPLIGLAKKEEIIIVPYFDSEKLNFKEIKLAKDNNALQLMQRIRDEAHRFAITYHRKLRSKKMLLKS